MNVNVGTGQKAQWTWLHIVTSLDMIQKEMMMNRNNWNWIGIIFALDDDGNEE